MKTTADYLYQNMAECGGREVTLSGWIRTVRESKALGFIELNDGTRMKSVQIVFEREKLSAGGELKFSTGCAVTVTGECVLTPEMKQPFEIHAREIAMEGDCPPEYPLQKKRHSFEYLRTQLHLRPRTNTFYAVFRVRSLVAQAIHRYFEENDFLYVHTPIITGSDCEGAGEMFRATTLDLANVPRLEDGSVDNSQDFFGKEANLTVSGQLYAESYALAFRNVYTFGPTFRAEQSYTARHAAEFWMIEPEMAFADLEDDMRLAEGLVKYIIRTLFEKAPDEMAFFNQFIDKSLIERLENVMNSEFAHVTYTEAVRLLEESGHEFEYKPFWGCDLQTEHERYLTEKVFGKPVFVTDYPKDIKAFYMRANEDGKTVAAMDLLVPGVGEIVGGSQREERLDLLEARIEELGMRKEDYWWYLELRRFGGCKHAGFGLGFERILMYVTGMANIRDVLPYPRTAGSAEF